MGRDIDGNTPLYPIGVAAELLGVSPRTLREYEKEGLIKPARRGGKRLFSKNDLEFIRNIRFYLEEVGMTIPALKILYLTVPCWEIKQCEMYDCPAYGNYTEKCWEVIARHKMLKAKACKGCPIFLVHLHSKGMKVYQGKDIPPKCFERDVKPHR